MEAARSFAAWPEQLRSRRFEQECERLRPLGEAYVMRRFGGSLAAADAEDAVAEVIIRLHRQAAAGKRPDNLRAAFFTSVRNAAVDQLRSRAVRPTVELAAAGETPTDAPTPDQRAELQEDSKRLQEALGRMRSNYREAIMLRFGLGLTVPQIAEQLEISLPAAKKLVLRSTAQARKRLEAIDGTEFCQEMREFAHRALIDKEVNDLCNEHELELLKAHFAHCGSCRSFVTSLRRSVHEFGSGLLLAGFAARHAGFSLSLGDRVDALRHFGEVVVEKGRLAAFRASGGLQSDNGAGAGAFAGAGQKIAAVCTVGAASAATCVATGIVGPGLGVSVGRHLDPHPVSPPAHVRRAARPADPSASYVATESEVEDTESLSPAAAPSPRGGGAKSDQDAKSAPKHQAGSKQTTPAQTEQSQFGIEEESAAPVEGPSPAEEAPPVAQSRSVESSSSASSSGAESSTGSSAGSSKSGSSGGGSEEFGFGG